VGLCEDYDLSVSIDMDLVDVFDSLDAQIEVYTDASVNLIPGIVYLSANTAEVTEATYQGIRAKTSDGRLVAERGSTFTTEDAVLTSAGNAELLTIAALQTRLHDLTPGDYLYVEKDEAPYAINADCLVQQGKTWRLGGYRIRAVPSDGSTHPVDGLWAGYAGGQKCMLAACNGVLWNMYDAEDDLIVRDKLGEIDTSKGVNFIPFDGDVYIQNGKEYYVYDGTTLDTVDGYAPLIMISIGPLDTDTDSDTVPDTASDAGELTGEYVNLLCGQRRVWISPDGTNTTFQLPEVDLKAIDYVIDLTTGQPLSTGYTADATTGTVAFDTAPAKAVNSYEIGYSVKTHEDDNTIPDYRAQVTGYLYAELYAGQTDSGLFFYGDGTNKVRYTGIDYNGKARADYFPDMYEAAVGDSNTPVNSMTRHGGILLAFKPGGECWALSYGQTQLATGDLTIAVYVQPINREVGNDVSGHIPIVENNPVTLCNKELYQWKNSSYYTSNLTRDERQAIRISDRVQASVKDISPEQCLMWDDNYNQEFYIVQDGTALVWNYAADAWYRYEGFHAVKMCGFRDEVLIGTDEGLITQLTYERYTDCGDPINAEWESGAIDFGASHLRKYSSMLWVGLKPEEGTFVDVCVETDRKNTFREKIVSSTKAKIPGQPFMVRSKIKAKKFVYYRLLLSTEGRIPAVTVTNVDFRVRQTGFAK
jgi:hypothetical protein